MTRTQIGLGAFVLGAGLMYFADPGAGRRRRRRARDRAIRAGHQVRSATVRTAADVRHRARGLGASVRHAFGPAPSDRVLEERVRARLGRCCSHPHAIDVFAEGGLVELSGPILASELEQVLREVNRVHGVREARNLLETHERPENLPALQGAPATSTGRRIWTPTGRLIASLTAGGLLVTSARLRPGFGYCLSALGLGLLARTVANRPLRTLVGIGDRRAIVVDRIFEVAAPLPDVFALWSNFESFPRFLSHVKQIERLPDGKYRWHGTGPLGSTVTWIAELSRYLPNRALAWRTLPDSPIDMNGEVRFRPSERGTRVELRLGYRPPAGPLGHGLAKLLGANPRRQIDEDVVRLKSLLEEGKATGRRETVSAGEIVPELRDRPPIH